MYFLLVRLTPKICDFLSRVEIDKSTIVPDLGGGPKPTKISHCEICDVMFRVEIDRGPLGPDLGVSPRPTQISHPSHIGLDRIGVASL